MPDQVASQFSLENPKHSRQMLEDFLIGRYNERKISAGWLGKALGLSFYEAESFLHAHGVSLNITSEELAQEVADLEKLQAR